MITPPAEERERSIQALGSISICDKNHLNTMINPL